MLHSVFALDPAELGAIFILSFVGILVFWFIILILVFTGIIFWLWMFIDCLVREEFEGPNDKIVWIVVLLFTSLLGAVLYFFLVRRKFRKREKAHRAAKKK
ncbi:PLDc N-terminal domain-containing protein [Candidatus Woesearchaeota archaeon]|nr:PLDc N-terminal domain-containing protein [Candidatus Woesearchaeota archaeon]